MTLPSFHLLPDFSLTHVSTFFLDISARISNRHLKLYVTKSELCAVKKKRKKICLLQSFLSFIKLVLSLDVILDSSLFLSTCPACMQIIIDFISKTYPRSAHFSALPSTLSSKLFSLAWAAFTASTWSLFVYMLASLQSILHTRARMIFFFFNAKSCHIPP